MNKISRQWSACVLFVLVASPPVFAQGDKVVDDANTT